MICNNFMCNSNRRDWKHNCWYSQTNNESQMKVCNARKSFNRVNNKINRTVSNYNAFEVLKRWDIENHIYRGK